MPLYLTFTTAKVKIKLPSYFFPSSHGWRLRKLHVDPVGFRMVSLMTKKKSFQQLPLLFFFVLIIMFI